MWNLLDAAAWQIRTEIENRRLIIAETRWRALRARNLAPPAIFDDDRESSRGAQTMASKTRVLQASAVEQESGPC
jgi:hypothetical protein